jgi:hypothetical protein
MTRTRTPRDGVHDPLFALDSLEQRRFFSATSTSPSASDLRSYDGTGNNLTNIDWGSAGSAFIRLAAAAYVDGIAAPAGADRPSAREISNTVAAHPEDDIPNAQHLAAFAYLWGQFIDHDLDLATAASPAEAFDVAVPTGDPSFDPLGTGTQVIPLDRSEFADGTGVTTARQQVNHITSYIDGSMVYGSDAARAAALRTFIGGHLKTSAGDLLPFNTDGLANANDAHIFPDDQLFLAGDVRANENIELTGIQTLFVREHNRLADQIAAKNPTWNDEQMYQEARKLLIGEIQAITYNEWLPALLGNNTIPRYTGYNPNVNVDISNEFATAAFRLGHSMLENDVEFLDNNGDDVRDEVPLAGAFFNPALVEETGIDPIMKYLASSNAEEIDNFVVDGVRNFLFGPPGSGGLDLASLNIQRGRDHGLADYNSVRAAMGLPKVTTFSQITSNAALAAQLQSLYGNVDDLDLWVGGLAEDHARGSNVGPTFQRILVDQFTRLRNGDRFWYQRDLSASEQNLVRSTSLSDIIALNTGTTNLQDNVFVFNVQINGKIFADSNADGRQDPRREPGLVGVTVELVDADGVVTQTATTGRNGSYRFEGVGLGDFVVRPVLPDGARFTTPATVTIDATRGQEFDNVNFGLRGVFGSGGGPMHGLVQADAATSLGSSTDSAVWADVEDLLTTV